MCASVLAGMWAAAWQNQQTHLCAQRWLRSAWASDQFDQSLRCALSGWLNKEPRFLHADSEDSDQFGRIWDFAVPYNTNKTYQESQKCSEIEPPRDLTNKVSVRPAKTHISLGIRPVWSESSLSARRNLGPLVTHWAHSEDSDQPGLIWVLAGAQSFCLFCHEAAQLLFADN